MGTLGSPTQPYQDKLALVTSRFATNRAFLKTKNLFSKIESNPHAVEYRAWGGLFITIRACGLKVLDKNGGDVEHVHVLANDTAPLLHNTDDTWAIRRYEGATDSDCLWLQT